MRDYLRKNWLNILLSIIAAISGADAAVGIRSGKSPLNVAVIPSILAALGASGTLGVRWLNNRQVMARPVREGLDPDFTGRLENLFLLARDPDVTPDHAAHLADMAGDLLLAEHRRAKMEFANRQQAQPQLSVVPLNQQQLPPFDLSEVLKKIEQITANIKPAAAQASPAAPKAPATPPAPPAVQS